MKSKFSLKKSFTFEAAHQLKYHDGKCARLHGHSFKLTVVVEGKNIVPATKKGVGIDYLKAEETKTPKSNMLMDYGDISAIVKPFIEENLDHHFLNETLKTNSPTSEYIASYCFGYFSPLFSEFGVKLKEIRISETCTSEAIYKVK